MKIVVLVEGEPPAGAAPPPVRGPGSGGARAALGDADLVALDQALRVALRRRDVEITAVTTGSPDVARAALAHGADRAVHVCDPALAGADPLAVSRVLAAVAGRVGFDLVLCGAPVAGPDLVPPMVAERLGVPVLCGASALAVGQRRVGIRRDGEALSAALPVLVSVTARCGPPRYPTFVTTAAARDKLMRAWTLTDLGIEPSEVAPATVTTGAVRVPAARARVVGDPTSVALRLADFLAERQFL